MTPLFSVILPTYNRARMARTAIETVLWQTLPDWECLVVDDGSTDGTAAMLKQYAGEKRIRALSAGRNQGMNASRNWAIQEARGKLITFLDSDDLWLPGRLEAFAGRAADGGFLYSNAWVHRFGRIIGPLFDPDRPLPEGVLPGSFAIGDEHIPYVTTNVAVDREALLKVGLFRTDMKTLDTELFARLIASGLKVAALRRPLSVRRIHGEQLTDRYVENFRESLLAIAASGVSEEEKEQLRKRTAAEVGLYIVKSGRPAEARDFLRGELGEEAKSTEAWKLAVLPAPALRLARKMREWALRVKPKSPDERAAEKLIAPLLARERAAEG